ncbi:hypothetical protein GGE65_008500 [Skermanella aerolata]
MLILEALMWTPEDRALVGDYGSGQALRICSQKGRASQC